MPLRKNKLGLEEFNPASHNNEHRLDITSMLEFSNQLYLITNTSKASRVNHREAYILIDNFTAQFEYLNDNNEREELIQLMLKTLRRTDDENNANKLAANNIMFLIFKFHKDIRNAINSLESNQHKPSLFISDTQKQSTDKRNSITLLKSLDNNLTLVFKDCFRYYGLSIRDFLNRFDEHPLWRSILSNPGKKSKVS